MARLLSQKEYAERKGVSPQYVNKLVRDGKIQLVDGRIDAKKADAALRVFQRPGRVIPAQRSRKPAKKATAKKATRKSAARPANSHAEHKPRRAYSESSTKAPSASRSLASARAEREMHMAELARLDVMERTGKLLPANQVISAEQRKNANFRTQLRKLARHVAPLAKRARTEQEVESVLLEHIDQLLETFAKDPLGLKPIDEPAIVPTEVTPEVVEALAPDVPPVEVSEVLAAGVAVIEEARL
jgi:transcriptional regulator with XRE-family HTH domain